MHTSSDQGTMCRSLSRTTWNVNILLNLISTYSRLLFNHLVRYTRQQDIRYFRILELQRRHVLQINSTDAAS